MSLLNKLRLLEPVKGDGITTHLSYDPETGRRYLLHSLPAESDPSFALIEGKLGGLSELSRQAILETGTRGGRTYLITEELPGFSGLEAWLHSAQNSGESSPSETETLHRKEPSALPFRSGVLPGEFTQLIRTGAAPGSFSSDPPREQPIASPTVPGEFTRLIHPPSALQPSSGNEGAVPDEFSRPSQDDAPQIPRGVQRPPGRVAGVPEPGEFTRLIQPRSSSQPTVQASFEPLHAEPLNRDAGREPSEFTKLTTPGAVTKQGAPPQRSGVSGLPETSAPGEFTRMFLQPTANSTPLLPGEDPFRQDFRPQSGPGRFVEPVENGIVNAPGVPRADKPLHGPSEYTRVFSPPPETPRQHSSSPSAPAADVQPSPEPRKGSEPSLWIAGGVLAFLALLAIILIVYFALKK